MLTCIIIFSIVIKYGIKVKRFAIIFLILLFLLITSCEKEEYDNNIDKFPIITKTIDNNKSINITLKKKNKFKKKIYFKKIFKKIKK